MGEMAVRLPVRAWVPGLSPSMVQEIYILPKLFPAESESSKGRCRTLTWLHRHRTLPLFSRCRSELTSRISKFQPGSKADRSGIYLRIKWDSESGRFNNPDGDSEIGLVENIEDLDSSINGFVSSDRDAPSDRRVNSPKSCGARCISSDTW